jgi:5-methylcytosine-specific restriction endonuclease McrA
VESKEEKRKREARERTRRWRERHPEYAEKARARNRERYERNKEAIRAKARERMRRLYAENPQLIQSRNNAWYARNRRERHEYYLRRKAAIPDDVRKRRERERNRRRYVQDPKAWNAYQKLWRERNPERAHAYGSAARAKRRGAEKGTAFTSAEWLALLEWHGGRCIYCGSRDSIEVDHRIPLVRGGSNSIDNVAPACRSCNRRKNRMTEDEFRDLLQRERRQGLGLGRIGLDGNAGTTRS